MRQLSNYRRSLEFSPASLGPCLWLEAGAMGTLYTAIAGSTTPADTGTVGRWQDMSGQGFDLTAGADDGTRPTWNLNSGLPYVNFTAASSQILRRTAALQLYNAGGNSVFMAARANPATSAIMLGDGNSADNDSAYLHFQANNVLASTRVSLIREDDAGVISASGTTSNFFNNADEVLGVTDDGANIVPYVNLTARAASTYTRVETPTFDRFGLGGWQRGTAGSFFTTRIYALVIVKRVLGSQETRDLIRYLGTKAGLSL